MTRHSKGLKVTVINIFN